MFDKSTVPTDDPMYEHIDRINQSIAVVRGFLKDKVSFDSLEDIPMLTGQAEIFFQGHLRRALAFLDGAKHAQDAGHELIEITAVRCLYESAACIHDFSNQLIRLIDAGQMTDAVLLAHQRSFAHRFEVKAMNTDQFDYTAVNVMKQIDAMGKRVPGARRSYDQLSEIAHPNAFGALFYFMESTEGGNVHFGEGPEQSSNLLLAGASLFSLIEDDIWRFQAKVLEFARAEIQRKIDDYEALKRATQAASC